MKLEVTIIRRAVSTEAQNLRGRLSLEESA